MNAAAGESGGKKGEAAAQSKEFSAIATLVYSSLFVFLSSRFQMLGLSESRPGSWLKEQGVASISAGAAEVEGNLFGFFSFIDFFIHFFSKMYI